VLLRCRGEEERCKVKGSYRVEGAEALWSRFPCELAATYTA